MGCVYLLSTYIEDTEHYKIGVTKNNVHKRISNLQTGNSCKILLINYYESSNYIKIENWLHRKYASNRTESNNEWFQLDADAVLNFIAECKKIDETINYLKETNPFYK